MLMAQVVYWFKEIGKGSLNIAGGKGANLGEMTNNGFPVPEGFVISAQTYFDFVKKWGMDKIIGEKCSNLDVEDTEKLQETSEFLKKTISSAEMPNEIRSEIIKSYNKLCGAALFPSASQEVFVAVRSSATAEDLPEASFAGQQATYLNVKGADALIAAVRDCWASLFEARAIYYRKENNFEDMKVGIAVVVQRMVQSDKSGVMFTVDPVGMEENKLVIEAGFGLGEAIVSGMITPDRYVVDKASMKILEKNISKQEELITRTEKGNEHLKVEEELQEVQKISEDEILQIAKLGADIERHYNFPQDIEWAIEGKSIYIVQSRAITTLKKKKVTEPMAETVKKISDDPLENVPEVSIDKAVQLMQGLKASPGIAIGPVKLIATPKELYKVIDGDIMVTRMTTPDFVPAMKRAAGIITDEGGSTCHAAIVSRELGIPCIVGTKTATKTLKEGQVITLDAKLGIVYDGRVAFSEKEKNKGKSNASAGTTTEAAKIITGTKIYVNLAEPEKAEEVGESHVDGIGLLRAEFMIAGIGKHPKALMEQGKEEEYIDALAKGLRKFCAAFYPRPVIYRASDFKTNEYKNLAGGEKFEQPEENPMIGYRGCFRYIKEPEVFRLELKAIKRVRQQYGMNNLHLMIPFVRRVRDFKICKSIVESEGLIQDFDFKLGIMCEVPSTVIAAEEFCKAGADFFSIGSNDLTQLTLGVDRDNPVVAEDFDERDETILSSIKKVIETCHKYGVKVGICGQAPSVYPEYAEKLVEYGIDSISVNPDVIDVTRWNVASAEKKVILKRLHSLSND